MSVNETMQSVCLKDLRPNNWFISRVKLDRVRRAWSEGSQNGLPPILVTRIDGELSLIDGHSRAYAAYENGKEDIDALVCDLDHIEGSTALYRHIHRTGPLLGIETIADLKDRIVEPDEHERLWIGYCSQWLMHHDGMTDKTPSHGAIDKESLP